MLKFFLSLFLSAAAALQGAIYEEPPEEFEPKIEVVALFIEHKNKILLLHRQENKPQGNLWGIPGGKIDKGETPHQAVVREIKEETGLDFSDEPIDNLGTYYVKQSEKEQFIFHLFRAKLADDPSSVQINFTEHKGYTWVTPEDSLALELMKDEVACFKLFYDIG